MESVSWAWGKTEGALLFGICTTNFAGGGIMTTDPVCGMTVDEKKKSEFQTQFAGRRYFFCSEECRKEFEADPGGYVETAAA
jgi:YHS domain-containing protein